jgi:hypothetical protein
MAISYRVFVVDGDSVSRISQARFDRLYRGTCDFPEYAGQAKQFAMVTYEHQHRRPERIIRVDCEVLQFGGRGELDKEHKERNDQLQVSLTDRAHACDGAEGPNVIDASSQFEDRATRHRFPELSGPALEQILRILFPS